jgi:hypothetical protein
MAQLGKNTHSTRIRGAVEDLKCRKDNPDIELFGVSLKEYEVEIDVFNFLIDIMNEQPEKFEHIYFNKKANKRKFLGEAVEKNKDNDTIKFKLEELLLKEI